jgi:hypothetical protein
VDPLAALWICSILGAALFAAAGFFAARVLAEKEKEASPPSSVKSTPPPEAIPRREDHAAIAAVVAEAVSEAEEKARQKLEALREELRAEILARTEAEKRASDLATRLVSSGQQVTALRAKIQVAEEAKRSGQYSAVKHQTQPPPRVSERPPPNARMQSLAPGLFGEIEELRKEVARLTAENKILRGSRDGG